VYLFSYQESARNLTYRSATIFPSDFTALGRPIRLADVLWTLKTVHKGEHGKDLIWNLCADDLREQSEETINFLYELLK
jgi:hypothetical protein